MSEEAANVAVVLRFFEDLTVPGLTRDERLRELADDAIWWTPGRGLISGRLSKSERMARSAILAPALADFVMMPDFDGVLAGGDQVAIETASSARNAVTGQGYANRYHWRFTVREGRIVELREYMDSQHFADVFGDVTDPSDSR